MRVRVAAAATVVILVSLLGCSRTYTRSLSGGSTEAAYQEARFFASRPTMRTINRTGDWAFGRTSGAGVRLQGWRPYYVWESRELRPWRPVCPEPRLEPTPCESLGSAGLSRAEAIRMAELHAIGEPVTDWMAYRLPRRNKCLWAVSSYRRHHMAGTRVQTVYVDAATGVFETYTFIPPRSGIVPEAPNWRLQLSGSSVTPAAFAPVAPD